MDNTTHIDKLLKFDTWMQKIKNIHYANNNLMVAAYERLDKNK